MYFKKFEVLKYKVALRELSGETGDRVALVGKGRSLP